MIDRIIAALAVVAAASLTWTATDHAPEPCHDVGHGHCCSDCASAVCLSCCAF